MAEVFRVQRTKDFTIMSNHHFKNKNLSLKAKGLFNDFLSAVGKTEESEIPTPIRRPIKKNALQAR